MAPAPMPALTAAAEASLGREPARWRLRLPRGRHLDLGKGLVGGGPGPRVMGILNVTPDSFSDGGLYLDPGRAVERGLEMLAEGADLLDLGAESTRPGGGVYGAGARDLPASEEIDRLLPVLEGLRAETDAPLSVDTRKGEVAAAALAAGADLVNDVSLLGDPDLGRAVTEAGCPLVLMHSRGALETMQSSIRFEALLLEVVSELGEAVERAAGLGVERGQIVVDPGIGFGKTEAQNAELIARLDALGSLGLPVLLGASRKSFLGSLAARPGQPPDPPRQCLAGSLAAVGWAALRGAAIVRVHDVGETVRFLAVWGAIAARAEAAGAAGEGGR